MHGSFDPLIVVLSVLTAVLAVYVALDLTGRVAATGGTVRLAWVTAGALATGVGLWTMHFTGMLALHLPVTVSYVLSGIGLALLIAVGTSVLSLLAAASRQWTTLLVILAGIIMGLGMGAMHVVAMGAMRMDMSPVFDNRFILASMVIAVAASLALVIVASRLRTEETWRGWRRRSLAALVIGSMIAFMHYTAMAGTAFEPSSAPAVVVDQAQLVATHGLAFTVIAACMMMVLLAIGGAAVDRALRHRLAVASEHARLRAEAEGARDAAEAANKAKSDFLAAMSHELRTPLNAIGGYTELLQIGVHGPLNAQQLDDLDRIQRSQKRLLGLINDVLNFAKIEAGKVEFHATDVRVADLLAAVDTMIVPQVRARDIRFECQPPPEGLAVHCDGEKAEQILLNLLSNAVKFTPAGGEIDISAGADDGVVRIAVRDTGTGIAADKVESIFEPFVQLGRALTQNTDGAGLGLAISRDLARGMGGELSVKSAPGRGSTFTLTLPASRASHEPDSAVSNGRHSVQASRGD